MKSIILSASELSALSRGGLSMVVRRVKNQPAEVNGLWSWSHYSYVCLNTTWNLLQQRMIERCLLGRRGDIVQVREDWCYGDGTGDFDERGRYEETEKRFIHYRSDWNGIDDDVKWNSARSMPLEYARYSLKLLSVEVRRVSEITEDEAKACGVMFDNAPSFVSHRAEFKKLYDSRHGVGAFANDWGFYCRVEVA